MLKGIGAEMRFQNKERVEFDGIIGYQLLWILLKSFKHISDCHHNPQEERLVTYCAQYDKGMRQRGSATLTIIEAAVSGWPAPLRTTLGG